MRGWRWWVRAFGYVCYAGAGVLTAYAFVLWVLFIWEHWR